MKLEIKEPCHEDWNKMKIGMISRHCDSCNKSVMDFTKMNRAEIITYILSNPNDQVCGRMTRDQFDFHHEDIPVLIETLSKTRNPNPFLIMALVCLSLSACAQEQTGGNKPVIEHTLGEIAVPPAVKDTLKTDTLAVTVPENIPLKGKVACEPVVEQGEVEPIMIGDIEPVVQGGIGIYEPEPQPVKEKIYQFAEKMPEYKGGMDAMFDFIQSNLKYPKYEKDKGIQGNVYVRFVVEKDGSLTRPVILKSVEGSKNFDSEVLRIIKMMPTWNPGENNGKAVPVYMTLPFQFKVK